MGFTYNYYYSKKIENISGLQGLLDNEKLDPNQRMKILNMQTDIINSSRSLSFNIHENRIKNFWYIMSYCGALLFFGIIVIINTIKTEKGKKLARTLFGVIIILGVLSALLTFFGWVFAFIPSPAMSYTLNIGLQIFCIWAIYYVSQRLLPQN